MIFSKSYRGMADIADDRRACSYPRYCVILPC